MKQKILWIVIIILAVSVATNLFLIYSNFTIQNEFNALSDAHDSLVAERDALKSDVSSLVDERDAARAELEILNGTYTAAVAECDSLTAERDALKVERDALTAERDALKTNVSILVDERDTARYNEYVLQGQVNQLNTDIAAIENERDVLKDQVNTLIVERDEARAEADPVRTRIKLVNHQASNDGTKITFSGYAVNTGIETLKGVTFHVTGYDLTSELVIDLYVLNMTINSGYYTHYSQTIEYAPLVLSAWSVDLLWGDLLPNNE